MEWYQMKDLLQITAMSLVVLIPVVGLTARFTLGPLIDRFVRLKAGETEQLARDLGELKGEVRRLREDLAGLETDMNRLTEASEFNRQLRVTDAESRRG